MTFVTSFGVDLAMVREEEEGCRDGAVTVDELCREEVEA